MGPSRLCVGLSVGPSVPATGSERRLSAELSSAPCPAALSLRVSPAQPIQSRGRPDNKTESRRITHISAEQKRRFNIKLGFDTLHGLVSTLSAQPSIKVQPPYPGWRPLPTATTGPLPGPPCP